MQATYFVDIYDSSDIISFYDEKGVKMKYQNLLGIKTGLAKDLRLKIGDRLFALDDTNGFKRDKVYTVTESFPQETDTRFLKVNT